MREPALSVIELVKRYDGMIAVDHLSFSAYFCGFSMAG